MKLLNAKPDAAVSPIGVDFGATGVRAVQLRRDGAKWILHRAAAWESRPGDGLEINSTVGERLGHFLRQHGFVGRRIVTGLSSPDLELHPFELDRDVSLDDRDRIAAAARVQIEQLMSFPDGTVETGYWMLDEQQGPGLATIGVAAPAPLVSRLDEVCRHSGRACTGIDAMVCAQSRVTSLLRRRDRDEIWGFLDLGYRGVRLALCVGDIPVLVRAFDAGGKKWTQSIADALHVSVDTAEVHKRESGIGLTGRGIRHQPRRPHQTGGTAAPPAADGDAAARFRDAIVPDPGAAAGRSPADELANIIRNILRPDLDTVQREIGRSFDYVLRQYAPKHSGDLVLLGGGGAMHRLDAVLSDRLGIPVRRIASYLPELDCRLSVDDVPVLNRFPLETLAGAVGLAINPGNDDDWD